MVARNMGVVSPPQVKTSDTRQNRMTIELTRGRDVVYKMRGYHAASAQFEYWQTTNPAAGPPSGRILQNIAIAAIITQKEVG